MPKYLIFSLLISFCLASCGKDYFFEEKKQLADGQWKYADSLNFKFTVADTGAVFNLYLDLVHADTFPFQNIYLKMKMTHPNGKQFIRTTSFDLFDTLGNSLGKSAGDNFIARITLQPDAFFGEAGEYGLTIEPFTRQAVLPVSEVKFLVEKTTQRR